MLGKLVAKIVGTKNDRELKRLRPIVEKINALEPEIKRLSDSQLQAKTAEFKERLEKGESLDHLLPEAFAVVREASRRTLGMRHFDVQLMGGVVLHEGKIAEMKTGEGKTLVATLPAYLNALTGKGVHIVTVNDYLAKRDAEWMGSIYRFLGLSVGVIVHGLNDSERKEAYRADITYGTNNEFGFDYLRDNMKYSLEEMVQREFHYAIVDEVDSILIDEARTPLIISGPSEESTDLYYVVDRIVRHLKKDRDFTIEEKTKSVILTEEGVARAEKLLKVENLYDPRHVNLLHHVIQALRAHHLFKRDVDYIVKEGKVIIVDEFTGRLMPGRRWSDGLHQAIEAKEGVHIESENQTLATITFQNFFRMYEKLAGMTGTAETEAQEFKEIYDLDVVVIPTNKPMIRIDHPDVVYRTEREKFQAVVKEIEELYRQGRPVLVGTISIEKSEKLSRLLKKAKIPHQVLNAKYHEREAAIIAQAGRSGSVTIATNMAGRGVDILLGGNPEGLAKEELAREGISFEEIDPLAWREALEMAKRGEDPTNKFPEIWAEILYEKVKLCQEDYEKVKSLGGLHIIGTERHESRRIDNQLRGRAGRQGDPGSSRFYLSLEDDLLRIFGSDKIQGLMGKLGMTDGEPIEHSFLSKAIEQAQKRVEAHNFDIRKHLLEYDDVMNKQREVVYAQRRHVLENENIKEDIEEMIEDVVFSIVDTFIPEKTPPSEWDWKGLAGKFQAQFGFKPSINEKDDLNREELEKRLIQEAKNYYLSKEKEVEPEILRYLERMILLQTIDNLWKEHLLAMDHLREGIGLRGYGQRDPLQEYKKEAFDMFMDLVERIKAQTLAILFRIQVSREEEIEKIESRQRRPLRLVYSRGEEAEEPKKPQPVRRAKKIGRNDPCPCGSGKKYKKCCGKTPAQATKV
ncbi:preprotein translocase subunit SecA [Thermosulfuriphilus ammonigenes]|uniref:Protein translocase subunit SecA n=1 Tax=Thermosulfuriphilus ammonigenes TaxID=1936021 RepID=A0A6G7PWK7_9BACT|nr:preprotein translocase subunit SecA [Thermosulfuriphilus ammonigenes]MBA2847904.1 preprotein translocase subunit SecA [Thermosulfuriphilus ammonigenes]QIJ71901.1 preprotein translocase subunit SecA [Thermosulfuriphilus ammonigenes]